MAAVPLVTKTPEARVVVATKAVVDALLEINTRNRTPKSAHIARIVHDISAGKFYLTASGVGVSKTGVLLDGQNRLMAIKAAGYPPVEFVLATGLDDASQRVVDRHAKRSLSDALTMHMNMTVSNAMVAIVNALSDFNATSTAPFSYRNRSRQALTDSAVAEFLANHADLTAEVAQVSKYAKAPICAAVWVYAFHHREKALEFAHQIGTGIDLRENAPAYRLRQAAERFKAANNAPGRLELFKLTVSACISHFYDREVKLLRQSESWASAKWDWGFKGADVFDAENYL